MGKIWTPRRPPIIGADNIRLGSMFSRKKSAGGPVTDNLLAWWKHDEGAGAQLTDYQNAYNGNIVGSGFWANNGPDANPVGTYDGATNYVKNIGTQPKIDTSITVVTGIYVDSDSGNYIYLVRTIGDMNPPVNYSCRIYSGKFSFMFFDGNDDAQWRSTAAFVSADTWYLLTFVYTYGVTASAKLYNGVTDVPGSWLVAGDQLQEDSETAFLRIGAGTIDQDDSPPSLPLAGRMGDMLIYNAIVDSEGVANNLTALGPRYSL